MVDTRIKVIDHFKKLRSPQASVDLVPNTAGESGISAYGFDYGVMPAPLI